MWPLTFPSIRILPNVSMLPSSTVPLPMTLLELLISSAARFSSFDVNIIQKLKGYKLFRVQGVAIIPQLEVQMRTIGHLSTVANNRKDVSGVHKITNFFQ